MHKYDQCTVHIYKIFIFYEGKTFGGKFEFDCKKNVDRISWFFTAAPIPIITRGGCRRKAI